jgi:hypothetical protein
VTGPRRRERPVPFVIHQLFEYFFAIALVVLSVHIGGSTLLLVAGIVLGVLAITAHGPLGLVRVCGPRLHAVLDIVAGVAFVLCPLVRPWRPDVIGIVAVELVAVAWLRMAMMTRYSARPDPVGHDVTEATVSDVVGPGTDNVPTSAALSAMRGLGRLTANARDKLPDTKVTLDAGARTVGTQAGRLHRAWRRAKK